MLLFFVCFLGVFARLGGGDRASNSTSLNFGFPGEIKWKLRRKILSREQRNM